MSHNHEQDLYHIPNVTPHLDHVDANHKQLDASKHDHHSMMQAYFHGGFVETILFEPWRTTSITIFIGSWILIFLLAAIHQGIKELLQCIEKERIQSTVISNDGNENELERMNTEATVQGHKQNVPGYLKRFLYSLLYITYLSLGYVLMLIAMTYNIYLFLGVILGIGTGYWLCTWSCLVLPVSRSPTGV